MARSRDVRTEGKSPERVQLLLRIPRSLHRALRHVAIDRETSMNDLVVSTLEKWWGEQPERKTYGG